MHDVYRELIDTLSGTPQQLREMLTDREITTPRSNETWGPPEVVAHLVDVEKLQRGRMQAILDKETPYLPKFDPNATARQHDYAASDLATSLEAFAQERGETLSLLMNLALKDWERTGVHDTFGIISIEDIAEQLIEHDGEHIRQIEEALG